MTRRGRRRRTRRSGSAARADRVARGAAAACADTVRPPDRVAEVVGRDVPLRGSSCHRRHPSGRRRPTVMPTYMRRGSRGSSWIECSVSPPAPGDPALARRMLEDAAIRLPGVAAVVGTEEHAGIAAETERLRLLRRPRLDVPRRLQRQARLLGQADLLRPLPCLATVRRALDGRPVDGVIRRRVQRPVTRVDDRVVHPPATEQRAIGLPAPAIVVASEQEEPLAGADECQNSDRSTSPSCVWACGRRAEKSPHPKVWPHSARRWAAHPVSRTRAGHHARMRAPSQANPSPTVAGLTGLPCQRRLRIEVLLNGRGRGTEERHPLPGDRFAVVEIAELGVTSMQDHLAASSGSTAWRSEPCVRWAISSTSTPARIAFSSP